MASCEPKPAKGDEAPQEEDSGEDEEYQCDPHSSDFYATDDSDEDPTFDILEETRSALSKISLKKSKSRNLEKETELGNEDGAELADVEIPKLNEKDEKCFEMVEKLIKDGQLEKLKVDQCKVYLRKYGLRLTGNKDVLLERIREHLEVKDGGGEKKYPISSFVLNCKGDACTGDVVLFEQKVYEMFSIVSRSAMGPPCGTRLVAGRIVKESYGAAKQQHTFTIEVLWSKGEKPLSPLHPLLIKGRNLYRLKTMRQKWADEEQRNKVLQEKHARGSIARCSRENRIQQKEMKKTNRITRMKESNGKHALAEQRNQHQVNLLQTHSQLKNIQPMQQSQQHPDAFKSNALKQMHFKSDKTAADENYYNSYQVPKPHISEFQALKPWNCEFLPSSDQPQFDEKHHQHYQQPCSSAHHQAYGNNGRSVYSQNYEPLQANEKHHQYHGPPGPSARYAYRWPSASWNSSEWCLRQPLSRLNSLKMSPPRRPSAHSSWFERSPPQQPSACSPSGRSSSFGNPPQYHYPTQRRQPCRFYRQGRCYFGDDCKYLHD